ncbi:uncharacterized protein LOC120440404 isoform X5 [Oreochromis aureus]|uniref:uncharacterized protein LOC120440404 isoform X5 n=1 Tax=Oreochromis aureus TaxID=47969 RepID=UPI0019544BB8|nr:uncharacterized protein LOC120440404 isoform X5 [Oreochromis aureus]
MVPQLYITVYNEQFRSPGTVKRAQLRPTSAHRRNNPQPRADFLFPRSLQSNNRSAHALLHPLPPVDFGRPLFPPVRHFSFHGPVTTCSDSYLNTTDKTQHMPPVNPSTVQAMPSADKLQKLQPTEPTASTDIHLSTALKSPHRVILFAADWVIKSMSIHSQHNSSGKIQLLRFKQGPRLLQLLAALHGQNTRGAVLTAAGITVVATAVSMW